MAVWTVLPSENNGANYLCYNRIVGRLQGSPVSKLSDQLDNLTTYQLKMHLWLRRFALVRGDPEEDPEKQAALVSEHLVVVILPTPCELVIGHCHFHTVIAVC
jgi:hypothetical protein